MTAIADVASSYDRYTLDALTVNIVYSDFGLSGAGNATRDIAALPPGAIVIDVIPHVGTAYDAATNDLLEIGHSGDADAFYTSTSIGAAGNAARAPGAEIGKLQANSVTVQAKYTCTGGAPSAGAARATIVYLARVQTVYGG